MIDECAAVRVHPPLSQGRGQVDVPVRRDPVRRRDQVLHSTKFAGKGKNPSAATNSGIGTVIVAIRGDILTLCGIPRLYFKH